MTDFSDALRLAVSLLYHGDQNLIAIVLLSLKVSLSAVTLATLAGLPLGALVALTRFPGRPAVVLVLNAFMGLPPVVVGLCIYLFLSRSGPLGPLGLLFTPTAMAIAQMVLVLPIIAALARQVVEDLWEEYAEQLRSLGCGKLRAVPTLLWDGRYRLATVVLAGFGRASAEVGSIIIVGGNIAGFTRTMTTAITLETSRGDLPLAMALGFILIALTVAVNGLIQVLSHQSRRGMA